MAHSEKSQHSRGQRGAQKGRARPERRVVDEAVIPVVRETVEVGKRVLDTGRGVRVHKHVGEHSQELVHLLGREDLEVERVPVERYVEREPEIRYEGDTLVVPLCDEVVVSEKRLMVREEVRVRRRLEQTRHTEKVALRSERATVEPFDEGEALGKAKPE